MSKFHAKPFDEATKTKLEIYRQYLREWLPVFIEQPGVQINIWDFFCGPGRDKTGAAGSPLIALDAIESFRPSIIKHSAQINIYFNDANQKDINQLEAEIASLKAPPGVTVNLSCDDFRSSFIRNMKQMTGAANLVFLDQTGIKQITPSVFNALSGLAQTDILFFISSSFFRRFRESDTFKQYLDASAIIGEDTSYGDSHRVIANAYRKMLKPGAEYYLAPFSIKKGSNIYGLIFGSSHLLGIAKFLRVCWKIDPERGEANFDIDQESLPGTGDTLSLFEEDNRANKLTVFETELQTRIKNAEFSTIGGIIRFSLENGFLPTLHAKPVVTKLIKEKVISCEGRPRFSERGDKEPQPIKLL